MPYFVRSLPRRCLHTWLLILIAASVVTSGHAESTAQAAVAFSGFRAFDFGSYTVGWSFTVNQPTEVSSLGYFDFEGNGLTGAHPVGIWNASGALLTSAVLPAGIGAPLSQGFRYASIPPLVLAPGNYMIGGLSNSSDLFAADVTNFSTSPFITYGTAYFTEGTTLLRPTIARPDTHISYFGPGMLISAAALDAPPTANAGADFSVSEGQPTVTLDGNGSHDPDGDALSYSWTQLSGGTPVALLDASTSHPSFTAPYVAVGGETLTFELTVTAKGQTAADTVSVTIVNVNHVPVADAGDDQSVAEGSSVILHGDLSFDADADPFTYRWTQVSGPIIALTGGTTRNPTFTAPFAGSSGASGVVASLIFELRVADGFPADAPAPGFTFANTVDRVTVQITNVNNAPVAQTGDDQTAEEHTSVALSGAASADPDNDILSYSWTQVSGPAVVLSNPQSSEPNFTAPWVPSGGADIVFQLTVDDGYGGAATDRVTVHVQNINDPPLANAARPTVPVLWAPDHRLVAVGITGVSDPDNNTTITITGVSQDEATNGLGDGDTAIDAIVNGNGTVLLRAERAGNGNGRVYRITFVAADPEGMTSGAVEVTVPVSPKKIAIDSGQIFDSTH